MSFDISISDFILGNGSPNLTFLLGQGVATRDVDKASGLALARDYPQIANFKLGDEATLGTISVPESFLPYHSDVVDIEKQLEDHKKNFPQDKNGLKKIERALSDAVEKDFFKLFGNRNKIKNFAILFFHGMKILKIDFPSNKNEQEIDSLFVNLTLKYIMNVEVKTYLGPWQDSKNKSPLEKAGDQLVTIRELLIGYFKEDLDGEWKFISVVFCKTVADFIKECQCYRFIMTTKDFEAKFDAIEDEIRKMMNDSMLDKHAKDFVKLAKNLLYLAPKVPLPTSSKLHSEIKGAIDKASTPENIELLAFPTPEQRKLLEKKDNDKYKLALVGPWGSGKTVLMTDFAIHLAKKGKKVLYLVFQSGIDVGSRTDPLLVLQLRQRFKDFSDNITVKAVPVKNGDPFNLDEIVSGYHHLFIDEMFEDLGVFEQDIIDKIIKVLLAMDTVAITASNHYHGDEIPVTKSLKEHIHEWLPLEFEVIILKRALRIPFNGANELKKEYKNKTRKGKGRFNEILMAKAKVPKDLCEAPATRKIGFDKDLSVEQVIKEAFKNVSSSAYALIIINDSLEGENSSEYRNTE